MACYSPPDPWNEGRLQEAIEAWKLSPLEASQLRELKIRLSDVKHRWNDPHVVLGFCTTYGFPTCTNHHGKSKTERKFRKMIQWRVSNGIDSLLPDYTPHPCLLDYTPVAMLDGVDHEGDAIYLERGGAVDVKGLLKRFGKDELMKYSLWLREVQCDGAWLDHYEKKQGKPAVNVTVIYDLEGLNHRHIAPNVIAFFTQYMKLTDEYYPGPIKRTIVIRAPPIFRQIWALIQHCFSEEARNAMIFAKKNQHLQELANYMDISVLPTCINPNSGKGKTAIGNPQRMDGGKMPSYIGKGGDGYIPPFPGYTGISQPNNNSNTDNAKAVLQESVEMVLKNDSADENDESSNPAANVAVDFATNATATVTVAASC